MLRDRLIFLAESHLNEARSSDGTKSQIEDAYIDGRI